MGETINVMKTLGIVIIQRANESCATKHVLTLKPYLGSLTLEPFSGVRLDPRGPERVIFLLSVRHICCSFLLSSTDIFLEKAQQ